jgi:hypothetical protein
MVFIVRDIKLVVDGGASTRHTVGASTRYQAGSPRRAQNCARARRRSFPEGCLKTLRCC